MNQMAYAVKILEKNNMMNCNSALTPMETRLKFFKNGLDSSVYFSLY